ncbi:hypothetical protein H310_06512 [Aphanomyces invadans]|uniref:Uncharacterized protein n=1 Tax=Aphanomyces invadans TaxID=157072 RepID=A0A024U712_9STRA|nr:hypothetical protein H310_06512 [Aphanomyces invadans]ETW01990.1 hypothetical protein H310_06512 [Aphanomyces invadans]|eukprot:XP_008869838.1 hypothetical protein H310_06512 [Aphanomyces invadans]
MLTLADSRGLVTMACWASCLGPVRKDDDGCVYSSAVIRFHCLRGGRLLCRSWLQESKRHGDQRTHEHGVHDVDRNVQGGLGRRPVVQKHKRKRGCVVQIPQKDGRPNDTVHAHVFQLSGDGVVGRVLVVLSHVQPRAGDGAA